MARVLVLDLARVGNVPWACNEAGLSVPRGKVLFA